MSWLIFSLIYPFLLAIVNYIDKYLLQNHFKGGNIITLLIFSSLAGFPVILLILLFGLKTNEMETAHKILIGIGGVIYLISLIPYFHALEKNETSNVAPFFLLIPVMNTLFGYIFLKESISIIEIFASLLIFAGSIGLSLSLEKTKITKLHFNKNLFILMLIHSILFASNNLIFKLVAVKTNFWETVFWEHVGFLIYGSIILIFVTKYRLYFFKVLRQNSLTIISANVVNEALAVLAILSLHFAILGTSIGLVSFVSEGFQPLFVLLTGIVITIFMPKLGEEDIGFRNLSKKAVLISIMVVGLYMLTL